MSDFLNNLRGLGNSTEMTSAGKQDVLAATQSPQAAREMALAAQRGNTYATENQIMQDRAVLSPIEMEAKYGPDVTGALGAITQGAQTNWMLDNADRHGLTALDDIAIGIGQAGVNVLGGIASLGSGLVYAPAGNAVAQGTQAATEWMQEWHTPAMRAQLGLGEMARRLDDIDNERAATRDQAEGVSPFKASLREIGRGLLSGAKRAVEDPLAFESGVSQGVGSLLTGGPVSRGLALGANAVRGAAGRVAGEGIEQAATWGNRAAMPAAVGLMEAGGSYSEVMRQIMEMPEEDLLDLSPAYGALLDSGLTPEQARMELASSSAIEAAALTAPAAMAAGRLTAGFEAAPLARVGARQFARDMGTEAVEEGLQGMTGQMAQNYALQNANEEQRLAEGVGAGIAEGAIFGAGTAGALRGPGTALSLGRDAAASAGEALEARGAAQEAQERAETGQDLNGLKVALQERQEAMAAVREAKPVAANKTLSDRLPTVDLQPSDTELFTPTLGALIASRSQGENGPQDRLELMSQLLDITAEDNPDVAISTRVEAAMQFLSLDTASNNLMESGIEQAITSMDESDPAQAEDLERLRQAMAKVASVSENQSFLEVMGHASRMLAQAQQDVSTDMDSAKAVVSAASVMPEEITPEASNALYQRIENEPAAFTDMEKKIVQGVKAMHDAADIKDNDIPQNARISDVNRQIEVTGGARDYQMSLAEHLKQINQAARANDQAMLKERMTRLGRFAAHMRNKAAAMQRSKATGKAVPYAGLGANWEWLPADKRLTVQYHSTEAGQAGSEQYLNQLDAEAGLLVTFFNNMQTIHKAEGLRALKPIAPVQNVIPEAVKADEKVEAEAKAARRVNADEAVERADKAARRAAREAQVNADEAIERAEKAERRKAKPAEAVVEAPVESKPKTLNEVFSSLVQGENNFFLKAFKLPRKEKSRMLSIEGSPFDDMATMLMDQDNIREFRPDYRLTFGQEKLDAAQRLLRAGRMLANALEKRLAEAKKDNAYWGKFRSSMVGNLMEGDTYNKKLLESGVLAALHWIANDLQDSKFRKDSDIANLLGVNVDELPDNDTVRLLRLGMTMPEAKQGLGQAIRDFWGLDQEAAAQEGFALGISEGLAAEIITVLGENASLKAYGIENVPMPDKTEMNILDMTQGSKPLSDLLEVLSSARVLIRDSFMLEDASNGYRIGAPMPKSDVQKVQHRNRLADVSARHIKALQKQNATPYHVNTSIAGWAKALGAEGMVKFMMGNDFDRYAKGDYNRNEKLTLQGRIRAGEASYTAMTSMLGQLEATGKPLGTEPVFFDWVVNRVGRMMMTAAYNPQSNKLLREVFMPTRAEIDMVNNERHIQNFWKAVGQGLGVKVELLKADEVALNVKNAFAVNGRFAPALQAAMDFLQSPQSITAANALSDALLPALGGKGSFHALQSIMSAAEYYTALTNGDDMSKFTTHAYLEADGKTNGPFMALMKFTTGMFTPDWVKVVAKGGFFPGMNMKTLADQYEKRADSNPSPNNINSQDDLYQAGATLFKQKRAALYDSTTVPVRTQMDALALLMRGLGMHVTVGKDGAFEISRNATKNPLTVRIYGSGESGVVDKVYDELSGLLYETLGNSIDSSLGSVLSNNVDPDEFVAAIALLTQNSTGFSAKKGAYFTAGPLQNASLSNRFPLHRDIQDSDVRMNFTLSADHAKTLKSNLRHLHVKLINEAIDDTVMSHVAPATTVMSKMGNIQSIFQRAVYLDRLSKALQNMPEGSIKQMGLSRQAMEEIHTDMIKTFPQINAKDVTFYPAGTEVGRNIQKLIKGVSESYGSNLQDKLRTAPRVESVRVVGVGTIPVMVIGTGDGRMMLGYFADAKTEQRAMQVYDGLNLAVDQIDSGSEAVNQSVINTLFENDLEPVVTAFRDFASHDPMKMLQELPEAVKAELKSNMAEAIHGVGTDKIVSDYEIVEAINDLVVDGERLSEEVSRRIAAIKRVSFHVDQMAGAEVGARHEGDIELTEDMSAEEVAQTLNNLLEVTEPEKKADLLQASPAMASFLKGRTELSSKEDLRDLLDLLAEEMPNSLKELAYKAARHMIKTDARIVFEPNVAYQGKYDPATNTVYVSNGSIETLVHEMVHASTLHKLHAYFEDPASLPDYEQNAIAHIEALAAEWRGAEELDAYTWSHPSTARMRDAMARAQTEGNKAAYLNEFMAYALTNQDISALMGRTPVLARARKFIRGTLSAIWKLVYGEKPMVHVGKDAFSNLRFSTLVLMGRSSDQPDTSSLVPVYMSRGYGESDRVATIRSGLLERVGEHLTRINKTKTAAALNTSYKTSQALPQQATQVLAHYLGAGFQLNQQEKAAFMEMYVAMASEAQLDTTALNHIQRVYDHALQHLKAGSLTPSMLEALQGVGQTMKDLKGRSPRLAGFIALATMNEPLRTALAELPKMESLRQDESPYAADRALDTIGTRMMDSLSNRLAKVHKYKGNTLKVLDDLIYAAATTEHHSLSAIEKHIHNTSQGVDNYLANKIRQTANRAQKALQGKTGVSAGVAQWVAASMSEDTADAAGRTAIGIFNKMNNFKMLKELVSDVVGITEDKADLMAMISKTRATIDQLRQHIRVEIPKNLLNKFKKAPSDLEHEQMFYAFAKADIGALYDYMSEADILSLVRDKKALPERIKEFEANVPDLMMRTRAKQLATYMMTGYAGKTLMSNAFAIVHLTSIDPTNPEIKPNSQNKLVEQVDALTTLYALDMLSDTTRSSLQRLLNEETEGMQSVLATLSAIRREELSKESSLRSLLNHYKGHIRMDTRAGTDLKIASKKEKASFLARGYTELGEYKGDNADPLADGSAYFFAPISGEATFNQGIMQTVRQTFSGVDPTTGYSTDALLAGRITDTSVVNVTVRGLALSPNTSEGLRPVFNDKGEIFAFERLADPAMLDKNRGQQNLINALGQWRGRQMEELLGKASNQVMLDHTKAIWEKEKGTSKGAEWRNAYDVAKTDPVLANALSKMPFELRNYANKLFGKDNLPVRWDLENDLFGYRKPSIGDFWTEETRWSDKTSKQMRNLLTGMFGKRAYLNLVRAERLWQGAVSEAKITIVVRSGIVPLANMLSNAWQLMMYGVPLSKIVNGAGRKTAEIHDYTKRRRLEARLDVELLVAKGRGDSKEEARLEARIAAIHDSYRRMSIWPLLEAGEFSAVTDATVGVDDVDVTSGSLMEHFNKLVEAVPENVRGVGRNVFMTKDSSTFRFMSRATQYGDFVAKAVLYDHLMEQGMSNKDAIKEVNEEFVNYNRLAGRDREYLEAMGLMWFMNFKLRIMKVAMRMTRRNPLKVLLLSIGAPDLPIIGEMGVITGDSAAGKLLTGTMDNALGIGTMFRTAELHPVGALVL